jgi:hypothetical protein
MNRGSQPIDRPRPPGNAITHESDIGDSPLRDAFATVAIPTPVRDTVRGTPTTPLLDVANLDRLPERDREMLRRLVQLRLLTYGQLRSVSYEGVHPSVTRRRVKHLVQAGLLSTWESPSRHGGHTRYALPTPTIVRAITAELLRSVEREPFAPLIELMIPQTTRRPLQLFGAGGTAPNWLAHQTEVNALLLTLDGAQPVHWMSSWDCPFPSRLSSFVLPQPDYVLIEAHDDGPRLIFGEHDRGSEPVDRFVARKVLLYAALAAFPEACRHHFGFERFCVRVSVTDPVRRAPMRRLMDLLTATRRAGGEDVADLFRFTLAGWLHAYPREPIWFAPADAPAHESVRWQEHVGRHTQDRP